jgi:hypothetical protein
MNIYKLKKLVNNICNNIIKTGEIKIKPRIKRLHFNKESKLTKNQKQSMGAQLGAKIKNNKTLELIEKARIECEKTNTSPTQVKIVEITGLSISTVKRNWNKQYNDLTDLNIKENNDKQIEVDYKLSQLIEVDEDLFFNENK